MRSRHSHDTVHGINLLESLCHQDPNNATGRDYLYYIAIGQTRLKKYDLALNCVGRFLQLEPEHRLAKHLQSFINQKLTARSLVNMAVTGGAALIIGGLIGLGISYMPQSQATTSTAQSQATTSMAQSQATTSQDHQQQQQQQQSLVARQISETFLRERQSEETYIQKTKLKERLYNNLRKCFKKPIELHIVGSSINNLGTNDSDVDIAFKSIGSIRAFT